jgi:hypothetical protein
VKGTTLAVSPFLIVPAGTHNPITIVTNTSHSTVPSFRDIAAKPMNVEHSHRCLG